MGKPIELVAAPARLSRTYYAQCDGTHCCERRERESQLEAEQRRKLAELNDQFAAESKKWQEQTKTLKDQFQQKLNYVAKLLKDSEQKYKNRESQKEDIDQITHFKQMLEEREREIACLTEEKRFFQLELMNRESTYNHLFGVQPIIGVLDPLQHHRKKGLKGERGKPQLPPQRRQVASSSLPPLSTQINISHRQGVLVRKSKSLEPSMIRTKGSMHSKIAGTCDSVSKYKSNQVLSAADNLVSTNEISTAETCMSQFMGAASHSNLNSDPDWMTYLGNSEPPQNDSVNSTLVHLDQTVADESPVTNHANAPSQDCAITFNEVDVPDSKMSILLKSHNSKESSSRTTSNFEMRSKSVETPTNEVQTDILSSTSTPSL